MARTPVTAIGWFGSIRRRTTILLVVGMMLVLSGCAQRSAVVETGAPASVGPIDSSGPEGRVVENATASSDDGRGSAAGPGAADGASPPLGGPREELVWKGALACVIGPGEIPRACPTAAHEFTVEGVYDAIRVEVTIEAPGVTGTNSMVVKLAIPNGTVQGTHFMYGVYMGGEHRTIEVTDPAALAQLGTWRVSVESGEVAATAVAYEARVSFVPHAEYWNQHGCGDRAPVCLAVPRVPQTISFHATTFVFAHLGIDWDEAAAALPGGFEPKGHPNVPLLSEWRGAPEGTLADVLVAVFEYHNASVDQEPRPPGRAAMAWLAGIPPPEYDIFPPGYHPGGAGYVFLGVVVNDPVLRDAFASWDVAAGPGSIKFNHVGPDPYAASGPRVEGEDLDFSLTVLSPTIRPAGARPEPPILVDYGASGGAATAAMYNSMERHNTLGGPASFDGTLGGLGKITTAGAFAQIPWFGEDQPVPAGIPGFFRFDHVDLSARSA